MDDFLRVELQEPLDKQAASRLAGAFNTIQLRQGETVAVEGGTVDRCFMVEFGNVEVGPCSIAPAVVVLLLARLAATQMSNATVKGAPQVSRVLHRMRSFTYLAPNSTMRKRFTYTQT